MAEDDGGRVEARLSAATSGLRGSPEHIETLRQRQQEADRLAGLGRPGAFARVLAEAGGTPPARPAARRPLRRGPAPSPRRAAAWDQDDDEGFAAGAVTGRRVIIRP